MNGTWQIVCCAVQYQLWQVWQGCDLFLVSCDSCPGSFLSIVFISLLFVQNATPGILLFPCFSFHWHNSLDKTWNFDAVKPVGLHYKDLCSYKVLLRGSDCHSCLVLIMALTHNLWTKIQSLKDMFMVLCYKGWSRAVHHQGPKILLVCSPGTSHTADRQVKFSHTGTCLCDKLCFRCMVLFSHYLTSKCLDGQVVPWWNISASQWHEVYCHDLEVVSSNLGPVEQLGVRSTSVQSHTSTQNIFSLYLFM